MDAYTGVAVFSLLVCLVSLTHHLYRLVSFGRPKDYSKQKSDTSAAIRYAYTGAMNPFKKESAFLHLPTYTAGIIYHLGTFLSISLFVLFLFKIEPFGWLRWIIIGFLILSGLSGFAILIKRVTKKQLRALSNPDDYISNFLVTVVHLLTAFTLINVRLFPSYFILVSILLLYLPLGKLKHTVYFFAARYHLGLFYGWRGVWPPNNSKKQWRI
jgi:nitrate reductase gamma subunit